MARTRSQRTAVTTAPPTPARPPRIAPWTWCAIAALAGWTALLLWVVVARHATPLYGVETDLLGEYIPAARELFAGAPDPTHYQFHGFGYPLLLAGSGALAGGDLWLAARLLDVVAALAAALAVWVMVCRAFGSPAGLLALLALLATPVFVRVTVEAGTDMPAFALAVGATALVLGGPRRLLPLAGALAGLAWTCRYDSVVVLAAGALTLVARRGRARALAAYAAGAALPIGAWIAFATVHHLDPFGRLNRLNIAYELYGGGTNWDLFWQQARVRFTSLGDVLRAEPGAAATHIARNLATRWWRDARELLPVGLGALAVPGMALALRRPAWRPMALHFALAYGVLSLTFYTPRYFLYLVPFYLAGAAALLTWPIPTTAGRWLALAPGRTLVLARVVIAMTLLVWAGGGTRTATRELLADPPDEVRIAGRMLRERGFAGNDLMARKPHAAYFAGMRHLPMPDVDSFGELIAAGRAAGAEALFFSEIEAGMRPQFSVLIEPDVVLPGLQLLGYDATRPRHRIALYRFTGETVDPRELRDSVLASVGRVAARRPGEAWSHTYLGGLLIEAGRDSEALGQLATAEQLAPADAMVARMQTMAYAQLGDLEHAATACQRAMTIGPAGAWEEGNLGRIRLLQGRPAEAREHLTRAVRLDPTSAQFASALGIACFRAGDLAAAIEVLERVIATTPADIEARLVAARAHVLQGDVAGALRLLDVASDAPGATMLHALADQVRARDSAASVGRGGR